MPSKIIEEIRNGKFRKIIVLTGAGVSTNAGIPDYRSPTGFFTELMNAFPQATRPEHLLTRSFVKENKVFEHPIYKQHLAAFKKAHATPSHQFCKWLYDKGWLVRVYTQNIDGLHQTVLPDNMVVEFHGSLIKNDVVLYDDPIPITAINRSNQDFTEDIDLILILGTSLKVQPFSSLVNKASDKCMKVLVDNDPNHIVGNKWNLIGNKYAFENYDTDLWVTWIMNSNITLNDESQMFDRLACIIF